MRVPGRLLPGIQRVGRRRAVRDPVASSVWVVTTALEGRPAGFTAISVASVSVDPPMLSFNLGRTSSSLPALRRSERFAVHLLGEGQQHLADRFAADARHRFADATSWRWSEDGLPVSGVVARLSGRLESLLPAGDSLIALGLVDRSVARAGQPLIHRPDARHRPDANRHPRAIHRDAVSHQLAGATR